MIFSYTRVNKAIILGTICAVSFGLSGCGAVILSYIPQKISIKSTVPEELPSRSLDSLSGSSSGGATLSSGQLQLKAIIRSKNFSQKNLALKVTLTNQSNFESSFTLTAEQLESNDIPPMLDLPIGDASLRLELINAEGEVLLESQASVAITPTAEASTLFVLSDDAASNQGGSGSGFSLTFGEESGGVTPTNSSSTSGSSGRGAGDSAPVDPATLPQNLRAVSVQSERITISWDDPEVDATGFNVYLDGELIAENHQLSSFGFTNLKSKTEYTIEVSALIAQGEMPRTSITETTSSASSSGGGGGGGGGGSSSGGGGGGGAPAPNNPPVIQSLVASKTTLSGVGLPVRLTATVTDETTLPASAYTWSCDECADGGASFNQTTGSNVIWTAPAAPGTYTMRLRVNDGVNPAVEQTQTITVTSSTADVIFTGDQA